MSSLQERKDFLKIIHTDNVRRRIDTYEPNKVLGYKPRPIAEET